MAKLLKDHAPDAYQQARAQIGDELRRAGSARTSQATSLSLKSDSMPSSDRWERPGFRHFSPRRNRYHAHGWTCRGLHGKPASRVSGELQQHGSAVVNAAQSAAPGIIGKAIGAARWAAKAAGNDAAVKRAMRADVPVSGAARDPEG